MKYCNRCKKSIPEISYLLHEKFCEYIPLEEYKYCVLCDIYLEEVEFADHMYCHELIDSNNHAFKSKESFEFEQSYEFIDKDEVKKEIEEQEIFEKKFNEISKKKTKSNIFIKKIIPYLFYCDNRYQLPRSLLICIIFITILSLFLIINEFFILFIINKISAKIFILI